jgi:uncharacterized protein
VEAKDLVAVAERASSQGIAVALVEQPYRVAGKRAPAAAPRLDAAWVAVVDRLRTDLPAGLPVIVGGRSLGARVACRTAREVGAAGVLCLAFPLQPPPRKGKEPGPSRLGELEAVGLPILVVQGESDRFGIPPEGADRQVVQVAGDHGLKADTESVAAAAGEWLRGLVERS